MIKGRFQRKSHPKGKAVRLVLLAWRLSQQDEEPPCSDPHKPYLTSKLVVYPGKARENRLKTKPWYLLTLPRMSMAQGNIEGPRKGNRVFSRTRLWRVCLSRETSPYGEKLNYDPRWLTREAAGYPYSHRVEVYGWESRKFLDKENKLCTRCDLSYIIRRLS